MLSRFSNEVLSRGSDAVLPQNLNTYWLGMLQKHSDDFLDSNFAVDQCTETAGINDPVLVACIHEVLRYNQGPDSKKLSDDELAEKITIYALSVTMETIRRESDMVMTPPTLENLLSIDRIIAFGKINKAFGRFLEQACMVPENKPPDGKSLFHRIKQRILARMTA